MERKNNIFSIDHDLLSIYLNNNGSNSGSAAAGAQPLGGTSMNFGMGGGSSYHEDDMDKEYSRYNNLFGMPTNPGSNN